MEDLDFYKKWCLAHLKFDKEKALKEDFRNQSSKDRVIKDLNKIENWGQLKRYVIENVKEKH